MGHLVKSDIITTPAKSTYPNQLQLEIVNQTLALFTEFRSFHGTRCSLCKYTLIHSVVILQKCVKNLPQYKTRCGGIAGHISQEQKARCSQNKPSHTHKIDRAQNTHKHLVFVY